MMRRFGPRSKAGLLLLILIAAGYGGFEFYRRGAGGLSQWDGAFGVILGLFICAQPAANFLDLLYRSSREPAPNTARRVGLTLNLLAVLAGISVIIIGTTQLARATGPHPHLPVEPLR
jgi:hypothetical protein